MKKIKLTQNKFALVDNENFEWLNQWKWQASCGRYTYYADRTDNCKKIKMHRLILNPPKGFYTDHINGNGLDNRKVNLRIATASQNTCNSKIRNDNTSGYKGISWYYNKLKNWGRWAAQLNHEGKVINLGYFEDKEKAAKAYNEAALKYHKEFAKVNKIEAFRKKGIKV